MTGEEGGVPRDNWGPPNPSPSPPRGGGPRAAAHNEVPDATPSDGGRPERPASRPHRSSHPEGGEHENPSQNVEPPQAQPTQAEHPGPNRSQRRAQERLSRKNTKAAIRIASLNIRGYRTAGDSRSGTKWLHVNQLLRDKKIGILAVQETHLTEERRDELEKLFSKRMKIFISKDPDNPTGRAGIAIVLNKEITNITGAKMTEIVPGRAIMIQTNWHKAEKITILAIYAPVLTRANENAEFWKTIKEFFIEHPRIKVDLLTGDFNVVEDMIDRLPVHNDPLEAVEELRELRNLLGLVDGWRTTHPTTKAYTFLQDATASQSRLDRIYTSPEILQSAREWMIEHSGVPGTDHKLVSVQVAHQNAPWIGKGRWSIPAHILKDKIFIKTMKSEGRKAIVEAGRLKDTRTAESNPQTVYAAFKSKIMQTARQRDKAIIPKIEKQLREFQDALSRVHEDESLDEDEKAIAAADIESKTRSLQQRKHDNKRKRTAVRNRLEGETICKYWTKSNKEAKPRDLIYALRKNVQDQHNQPPTYETNSKKMADLGKSYHESLQSADDHPPALDKQTATQEVLDCLTKTTSESQKRELADGISRDEIKEAIKKAKNDTAAGLDGATNELWKALKNKYDEDSKIEDPNAFDVVDLLGLVFNDILEHGITQSSSFAEGWMCPLYKKNDKNDIANYRPITCLNTDYKLYTKCLAIRLADVAPDLIHPSQAGFIPGRRITDQTKLIRLMMQYAESTKQNGLIVALDQEKAYDKIDHQYLWQTLTKFEIPEKFINTVKSLYENAETQIMINGFRSSPWKITRGVRQGDPLSCMLFDLAIEPLAASLRASDLQGFQIPGIEEKLIANLFADDTTVFLSENDNFSHLTQILNKWCTASTAKFNNGKTEIIPIGEKDFRENVMATRKTNQNMDRIPENAHIVLEGEAVRILGAWYRNGAEAEGPWSIVLDKIDASLERWERSNPTIEGRKLITSMVVGGMTQYLTQVQGMPKDIEKKLTKVIRTFVWKEKKSPISETTLFLPIEEGGRALLDLESRNEAIEVMWLKSYLDLGNKRPLWASVADELLALNVPKTETNVDKRVRHNVFLQSWKSSSSGKAGISADIRNLQKTAKKFGLRTEGIAFSKDIANMRPIWYHCDASKKIRRLNNGATSECLKSKHRMRTVGDAAQIVLLLEEQTHIRTTNCVCTGCTTQRTTVMCEHPHDCAKKAEALLNTLHEKWDPRRIPMPVEGPPEENPEDGEAEWSPLPDNMLTTGSLANIFRIFTQGEKSTGLPRVITQVDEGPVLQVATDGSCFDNGLENANAGAGIFYSQDGTDNLSIKVPQNYTQSNQTAEILALKEAIERAPPEGRLHIELDSKYVIQNVTSRLQRNEDEGYIITKNADLLKLTLARIRARGTVTRVKWVKGHSGHERNEGADKLADAATNLPQPQDFNGTIDLSLQVTGARLQSITQALAYKTIRDIKATKRPMTRTRTQDNLAQIKDAVEDAFGGRPTSASIWKSVRRKEFSRPQRYFLWMAIHDAYMIGTHWLRATMSQEMQERATCTHDGSIETMKHILTQCECTGQQEVWTEMENLWNGVRADSWYQPTLGLTLGTPMAEVKTDTGRVLKGKTRLFRILMVESAHLIWKLRCERLIQNENRPHSKIEIRNRWRKALNDRLDLDQRMTDKRYREKALPRKLVLDTWAGALHKEENLPEDWIGVNGVLVGIGDARRQLGIG
ncbi:hypothetical protein D9615_008538 [Tricholomella constricta]|uniref:Reverse transcriptase n=1 Tax=Tricholomella constricta TaxID=117010 RepID=A0A8H5H3V1_9AGAR|nr:hypothetical protein D9615_008538 [Tricholomella constricta]